MEGTNQNYIVYDKMLEMGWRNQVPDLDQWCIQFKHVYILLLLKIHFLLIQV